MRVAIITESFPPDVNGVAHCVARVAELLAARGHQPLVIAPQPSRVKRSAREEKVPYPVVRVPAAPLPGYPGFRLGLPSRRLRNALTEHRTEVVHLASPVVLGAHGAAVAKRLGLPVIAVFQEAAASGLPVVAPAAGGPLDLVEDGVTGYLVPPGDVAAFPAAVARLAADPAARVALGAAGRRKVLGRSWPALTDELIGHYAAVLGRERAAPEHYAKPARECGPSRPARAARERYPGPANEGGPLGARPSGRCEETARTAAETWITRASREQSAGGTGSNLGGSL